MHRAPTAFADDYTEFSLFSNINFPLCKWGKVLTIELVSPIRQEGFGRGLLAEPLGKELTRPRFPARKALAPRPRPRHSGKVKLHECPGRAGNFPKGI